MTKALDLQKDKRISADPLLELSECVLKNTISEQNRSFYKQLRGTAFSTKMAPQYGVIFYFVFLGGRGEGVSDLEKRFFNDCDISPLVWWRYEDNIFMLWQHGEKGLENILEKLSSYNPDIKFTANYSMEKIGFLDVKVVKKRNQLVADHYIKPIDAIQCLYASSCHVFHFKVSIHYRQTLRLNRICCTDLQTWLRQSRYSDNLIRKQILKAMKFSRTELLKK